MTLPKIIASLLAVAALTACEKELDFRYHDIEPLTVIEGAFTPDGVSVAITLTTPMDEPMDRIRLTDAAVTLEDMTDSSVATLLPDPDGKYVAPAVATVGHDYRLTVSRDGATYSSVTTMLPPVEIKSLEFNWIKMPYDHVAILQGRIIDNPAVEGEYYWVRLYRNGESYRWLTLDDRGVDADGEITFTIMTTRRDIDEEDDDDLLLDGDIVECVVCPVTSAIHTYLQALMNGSNGPALFDGPRVLGYFMATTPASASITFHPDLIPDYK